MFDRNKLCYSIFIAITYDFIASVGFVFYYKAMRIKKIDSDKEQNEIRHYT